MRRDEFREEAETYMYDVFESYPELQIGPEHVNMCVTAKQKRILGNTTAVNSSPFKPARIGLSWDAYNRRGYSLKRLKETIRHELVHANNWFVHGFMAHGPTFKELAAKLDVPTEDYENNRDPKYQYVKNGGTGTAGWNHYDCKNLRWKRENDKYEVFSSVEDIRDYSPEWREESDLTRGLSP